MAIVTLAYLGPAASGLPAAPAPVVPDAQRAAAFQDSLQRHAAAPELVAQVNPVQQPAATPESASGDAGADARARRGLDLDGATVAAPEASGEGDMILDGLQRLRGVFDAREARVSELMNSSAVDSHTLLAMQMEVTQFTLLVDMTSKLTGKTTQAVETLMKGQ